MRLVKRSAFALAAAALLFGCGSAGDEGIQRKSAAATVTPRPFDTVVECGTLGFGVDVTQFSIGLTNEPGSVPAYELQYPVALDGLGQATLVFSEGNTVVDFSVTGVRVLAAIVRSYDTGTNAYVYADPGVTSDVGLSAPAATLPPPDDDTRISRVKLCVVPAEDGCTYTQGYWKTHSDQGPAQPDATWNLLPGGLGEETMFFGSGLTWLQVLRTPPRGNVYFQLAHQYIAARLNVLAGVSAPAQLATATTELTAITTGTTVPAAKRALFLSLAGALGDFNEGTTGPGHCEDEVIGAE